MVRQVLHMPASAVGGRLQSHPLETARPRQPVSKPQCPQLSNETHMLCCPVQFLAHGGSSETHLPWKGPWESPNNTL